MDEELSWQIVRVAFRSSRELQELLKLLKDHASAEEYRVYAAGVARAIDAINDALLNPVTSAHPEIAGRPSWMPMVASTSAMLPGRTRALARVGGRQALRESGPHQPAGPGRRTCHPVEPHQGLAGLVHRDSGYEGIRDECRHAQDARDQRVGNAST